MADGDIEIIEEAVGDSGEREFTYDDLYRMLFEEAMGSKKERTRASTVKTMQVGPNGAPIEITQHREVAAPNVNLAMRLLENRIGGPQDYC